MSRSRRASSCSWVRPGFRSSCSPMSSSGSPVIFAESDRTKGPEMPKWVKSISPSSEKSFFLPRLAVRVTFFNVRPDSKEIAEAIGLANSPEFRAKAASVVNPYGDGCTTEKIVKVIKDKFANGGFELKKKFFDVEFSYKK